MYILNEENSPQKIKQKLNKKEPTNPYNKFNNFLNNSKIESSFSNNLNLISGYSTIANQVTEFSSLIGNQIRHNEADKTLKDKNKLTVSLDKKLNHENINDVIDKKLKAFNFLEDLDNLPDSEFRKRQLKIPKLDFSEIFRNYKNTHVKIKIVRGLSSSSVSSKNNYSSSSLSKEKHKHKKHLKKKQTENFHEKKGFCCRDYYSKNTENINGVYSKVV